MKALPRVGWAAAFALASAAILGACRRAAPERIDGPHIYVRFDERHQLTGGEAVKMQGFDIGRVEGVDLSRGQVRAELVVRKDMISGLTKESTFLVETSGDDRWLEGHVLNPDAEPLSEGDSLEGVDSEMELAILRARQGASELLGNISDSEWFRKANDFAQEMERAFEGVDWGENKERLAAEWQETAEQMDALAGRSAEEAEAGAAELAERIKAFAEELEKSGHGEEAEKLRRRFRELIKR